MGRVRCELRERAVFLALFLASCGGDRECERQDRLELSLRADLTCPSARDVESEGQLAYGSVSVDSQRSGSGVWYEPRTICWYRIEGDNDALCLDSPSCTACSMVGTRLSRTYFLDQALRTGHDAFSDYKSGTTANDSAAAGDQNALSFVGCDADGPLYASTRIGPVTDLNAALSAAPTECPAEITPDPSWTRFAPSGSSVSAFVGRDFYPARVLCSYLATKHYTCSSGGLGAPPSGGL